MIFFSQSPPREVSRTAWQAKMNGVFSCYLDEKGHGPGGLGGEVRRVQVIYSSREGTIELRPHRPKRSLALCLLLAEALYDLNSNHTSPSGMVSVAETAPP